MGKCIYYHIYMVSQAIREAETLVTCIRCIGQGPVRTTLVAIRPSLSQITATTQHPFPWKLLPLPPRPYQQECHPPLTRATAHSTQLPPLMASPPRHPRSAPQKDVPRAASLVPPLLPPSQPTHPQENKYLPIDCHTLWMQ